jgi:hypothetical protein
MSLAMGRRLSHSIIGYYPVQKGTWRSSLERMLVVIVFFLEITAGVSGGLKYLV